MNALVGEAAGHLHRGIAQRAAGDWGAALESFDQAVRIDSRSTEAWNNKGFALVAMRRLNEALDCFDQARRLDPTSVSALYNRGNVLMELDRAEEALDSYRLLLQVTPNDADALTTCGIALLRLRRPGEALEVLDCALRMRPNSPLTLLQRGIALTELGRPREALQVYASQPLRELGHPEVHYRCACAHATMLRLEETLRECASALTGDPDHRGALFLGGMTATQLDRCGEAIEYFDRLLAKDPDYPYARGARLAASSRECRWQDAAEERLAVAQSVLDGKPVDSPFPSLSVSDSARCQRVCAETFVRDRFAYSPPQASRTPLLRAHHRIRLAYVSRDLGNHAVSRLMVGVFERHDRTRFEVSAISLRPAESGSFGRRVRASFDNFIDVSGYSDLEVCALMERMEIDIAVDLAGFTAGARTGIFARRPAPVQVNYLGYPGTMGAPFMDYLIADPFVVPPDMAAHYSERIVHLPECFQANDDRREVPVALSRQDAVLPESAFVWCCFNANAKLNPEMFRVWMRLLRETPGSVLWLLAGTDSAQANLRREAAACDIDPDRIVLAHRVSYERNLARLCAADLFLDTTPFSAGATASDVLWAGLPLLTYAGEAFAARMAGSLLRAVDLPELIAPDLHDYERRALALARAPEQLARLRRHLEAVRRTAPLWDTARFCGHLESAYRHMVERARRSEPPAPFAVEPLAGQCRAAGPAGQADEFSRLSINEGSTA